MTSVNENTLHEKTTSTTTYYNERNNNNNNNNTNNDIVSSSSSTRSSSSSTMSRSSSSSRSTRSRSPHFNPSNTNNNRRRSYTNSRSPSINNNNSPANYSPLSRSRSSSLPRMNSASPCQRQTSSKDLKYLKMNKHKSSHHGHHHQNHQQQLQHEQRCSMSRSRSTSRQNIAYRHHFDQHHLDNQSNDYNNKKQYNYLPEQPSSRDNHHYHHHHHHHHQHQQQRNRSRTPDNNYYINTNGKPEYSNDHKDKTSRDYYKNEPGYYSSSRDKSSRDEYHHHHHQHQHNQGSQESKRHSSRDRFDYDNHHHHHHQQNQQNHSSSNRHRTPEKHATSHSSSSSSRPVYYDDEDERERFAGDYTSICLKNLNETLRIDDLREHIYNEFRQYRDFTVKVVNNRKAATSSSSSSSSSQQQQTERIAFVNFSNHADAKHAKRAKTNKYFFGYHLYIEPVFRSTRSNTIESNTAHKSSSNRRLSPQSNVYSSSSRRRSLSPLPPPPPPPPLSKSSRQRSRSRSSSLSLHKQHKSHHNRSHSRSPFKLKSNDKIIPDNESRYRSRTPVRTSTGSRRSRSSTRDLNTRNQLRERSTSADKKRVKKSHDLASRLTYPGQFQHGGVSHYFDNDERDATRTLFIGNLDNMIDTKELKRIFEPYGIVDEIDIKRNQPVLPAYSQNDSSSNSNNQRKTYAFVKYLNMDMAITAKYHLNGIKIGKNHTECRIGYGKVQSTNCLWVGGLTDKSRRDNFEQEFEDVALRCVQKSIKASSRDIYKDRMVQIDWRPNGEYYAYVLFNTISQAEEARSQLRGVRLINSSSERLRIDYVDPKMFTRKSSPSRTSQQEYVAIAPEYKYRSVSSERRSRQYDYNHQQLKRVPRSPSDERHVQINKSRTDSDTYSSSNNGVNKKRSFSSSARSNSVSPLRYDDNNEKSKTRRVISSPSHEAHDSSLLINSKKSLNKPSTEINTASSSGTHLLAGTNFENIIITKTENTRHVNKLSDIINNQTTDNVKLVLTTKNDSTSVKSTSINVTSTPLQPIPPTVTATTEVITESTNQKLDELPKKEDDKNQPENQPQIDVVEKRFEKDDGEIVDNDIDENKQQKIQQQEKSNQIKPNKKSIKQNTNESKSLLICESQLNVRLVNNQLKTIDLISDLTEPVWSGVFTLKKHVFPTRFFMLAGEKEFADQVLPHHKRGDDLNLLNCLRISQRLRLDDSKVDELEKKLIDVSYNTTRSDFYPFSMFVSIPLVEGGGASSNSSGGVDNQYHQKSLHNLIGYLDQKNAAGVIPLPDDEKPYTTMHAFTPNCSFSNKILNQLFPHLKRMTANHNDFILIVIFKNSSTQTNTSGTTSNILNSAANSI